MATRFMIKNILLIAVLGALTGTVASLAAIGFVYVVGVANELLWVFPQARSEVAQGWFILVLVLIPGIGGLIVGLINNLNSEKRPLNLMDTISAAQLLTVRAPIPCGLRTALASMIAIGSGASVGQYGPIAHMGATLGTVVSNLGKKTGFSPAMGLGCGAAAAIATTFNAPIAGLIFAHEVILRHYSLRSFAPITVAAAIGYLFANYLLHKPPIFALGAVEQVNAAEFLVFVMIGVLGAYVAALLITLVLKSSDLAEKINLPLYLKPAVAGVVLGIMAIWVPEILGLGEGVMQAVLSEDSMSNTQLITVFAAKLIATAMCLGFGFAGGIFSPSLLIGLIFGGLIGELSPLVLGDHYSGSVVYALCGMVAVASPVIGAPLTAILIVFELTRNYEIAIAAMVSVVFANLVGYQLTGRSIFDVQLKQSGIDLTLGRDKVVLDCIDISDLIVHDYVKLYPEDTLEQVKQKILDSTNSQGFVVDSNNGFIGVFTLRDTISAMEQTGFSDIPCEPFINTEVITMEPETSIWVAMDRMQDFVGESMAVVSANSDSLEGVVYEASILKGYKQTLKRVREEEYSAS